MVQAILWLAFCQADTDKRHQPLTTALAVRALSPSEAALKRPVKLVGVVTHATPAIGDCFLHDETAGIYISESALAGNLTAGDRIEVEGVTDPGTFAPMVVPTAIRKLGMAPLPDPEPYDLRPQDARWLDGQYVQIYAHARELSSLGPFTTLTIVTSAGIGQVRIPGKHDEALRSFIGRTVRVRGVCVPKHDRRQMQGPVRVYAQSSASLSVVPGPQRPAGPAPIAEYVKGFTVVPHLSARPVILAGVVTARINPTHLFLQDDSGGVLVATTRPTDAVVGDQFEADGFLSFEGPGLLLLQASLTSRGAGELPAPLALPTPLFDQQSIGRLVQVAGIVEETSQRDGTFLINLHDGPVRFQADLETEVVPPELAELEVGTRVSVTGVAHLHALAVDGEPREPRIYLRFSADIAVLAQPPRPPWWTTRRVLLLVAVFAGIVGLCGLWVWLLRRQVQKQMAVITANFQREAQLSASLRQARKLEAVGRLTAGIAHDFNNLLTVILGNCELLLRHLKHDPAGGEMVALACDASQRAADLTRQLLTFSRQTPVHLEPLDLNAVVRESQKLLGRVIGANVRLTVECATQLPLVHADKVLLHQVILNLGANARDAMPRGGELTIRTSLVKGVGDATMVRLAVTDTGCGMDEATKAHVFEPFFTTKEVGKGTGLGLATVYGAVATLKGAIQVLSAVDRGATFLIDLPPAPEPGAALAPPSVPAKGRGAVILVVDDNEGIRRVCVQAFERYGYTVLSAGSASEALELARTKAGAIDLLVSDLIMPGMNGRDLAAIMRSTQPKLRVLFMTGYPADEVARMIGDLPDVEVMVKPFTPVALATRVQDILEEGQGRGLRQANENPAPSR